MKVVGLDMPYDQHEQYNCNNTDYRTCPTSSHFERNKHMVKHIQSIVKKGGKIVAFMHYWHAASRNDMELGVNFLLKKVSTKTIFIKIMGSSSIYTGEKEKIGSSLPTAIAARKSKIDNQRFYISGTGPRSEDYIIHLPQIY